MPSLVGRRGADRVARVVMEGGARAVANQLDGGLHPIGRFQAMDESPELLVTLAAGFGPEVVAGRESEDHAQSKLHGALASTRSGESPDESPGMRSCYLSNRLIRGSSIG